MHATRAAVEEGCVYGGGAALLNAAVAISDLPLTSEAQVVGATVITAALESPFCRLVESANKSPVQVWTSAAKPICKVSASTRRQGVSGILLPLGARQVFCVNGQFFLSMVSLID
jgi:chaperonin GroEL (HSP60 family)